MDWLRLFTLLIAVASIQVTAEGPKKKIRIHLPQKVKHIHHHKKIYITNHPASSQYAPAYVPSAEGAVAVPSNVGLPAVAGLVPLNSVELYDEQQPRLPGAAPSASKLLPLYKARGYYGTAPADWDEQEYDLSPPPEQIDDSDYPGPPSGPPPERNHPPKRVKVIKITDTPRKKATRKPKPKRVPARNPRPPPEEEHPVSSFHEQFYSDLDGLGTVRKIRKPPRVEKIVDGDTEHIHTYSEEHIHKVVFDDGPKIVGVDPVGSMSAISASRPLIPLNHGQALLAIPSDTLSGFAAVGPLGEYAAYNPRDVTHDHIFHDHGEIPADVDLTKEPLGYPPKISYNSQGLRLNGNVNSNNNKRYPTKYKYPKAKPTKPAPANEYSYYESIYTPFSGLKKFQKPKVSHYDAHSETNVENYRPVSPFKALGTKHKPRALGHSTSDFRMQQASVPAPFSVSSTIVHDYQPKGYSGSLPPTGFSKFKDPFGGYKDSGYTNNFEYDTYASSSNVHTSEDKNDNSILSLQGAKGKKKSVSTQNIRFGGQDHESLIDHLGQSATGSEVTDDETPSALDNFSSFDESKPADSATSTPFTIRESSPVHQYYTAMAVKAMQSEQGSMPESSNDNFQYAEAPTQSTSPYPPTLVTTTSTPNYFELQNSNAMSTESPDTYTGDSDQRRRPKPRNSSPSSERDSRQRYPVLQDYKADDRPAQKPLQDKYLRDSVFDSTLRGQLKYGDKI